MRRLALVVAVVLLLVSIGFLTTNGVELPLFDFVEYWAAGRLCSEGKNPYDPEAIHRLEQSTGREAPSVMMWNPPWVLPLVVPFGLIDVRLAHLLWLSIQFGSLLWACDLLWHFYGGAPQHRWIAILTAFTFLPSLFALIAGQISPLLLLGLALFLHAQRNGQAFLAGLSTLLLAIKPQLLLLVFLAVILSEIRERRWRLLAAGLLAGVASVSVAMLFNPNVVAQYWEALSTRPPAQYRSPTLGTLLRLAIDEDCFALQFVPPCIGICWLAHYWWRRRDHWNWAETMPLLLFFSILTAAYGAWPFDLVVLLVPVIQVALHSDQKILGGASYLLIGCVALIQLSRGAEFLYFVWMTPALLVTYLCVRRSRR